MFAHHELVKGDVDAALAEDGLEVIEATYRVGHQEQLYIENNAMIAVPREDGGMTVHGSLQCPYYVHKALRTGLGLDDAHAQVVQAETGGGFGGKEEYPSMIALHAALLARRAGRPVRMIYDRHEDLSATTKRHPAVIRHRTGVRRDGTIVAQDIELVMDGGAYTTLTPVVLSRATIHAGGPYDVPNVRIRSRAVATNTPPNGAFRGFGAPQAEFAAEMQVSRAAEAIGMSPLEIRRRNAYRPGGVTPTNQQLRADAAALEVLDRAAEASEFDRVRARTASRAGAAGPGCPDGTRDRARARVARRGVHGLGRGEDGLGREPRAARATRGSGSSPPRRRWARGRRRSSPSWSRPSSAWTSTTSRWRPRTPRSCRIRGRRSRPGRRWWWAGCWSRRHGGCGPTSRAGPARRSGCRGATTHASTEHVRIDERFSPYAGRTFDDATYSGDAYPTFGWAAAVAEVEVDLDTAEVAVLSVVAVDDVGRVIHPVLCEGQVEGGTLQAVGYATIEEIKLLDGRYLNDRLQTYLIPTSLDAPRIDTILVEAAFEDAPHRAKGVGELPMDVGAPAVVAAIHDATGAWIDDLPATPERILAALAGIAGPGAPGVSAVSAGPGAAAS